jgi:hypothetical protein
MAPNLVLQYMGHLASIGDLHWVGDNLGTVRDKNYIPEVECPVFLFILRGENFHERRGHRLGRPFIAVIVSENAGPAQLYFE